MLLFLKKTKFRHFSDAKKPPFFKGSLKNGRKKTALKRPSENQTACGVVTVKKSICFLSEKIYPLNLKIKQYLLPNRDNL